MKELHQIAILGTSQKSPGAAVEAYYHEMGLETPESPEAQILAGGLLQAKKQLAGFAPGTLSLEQQAAPEETQKYMGPSVEYHMGALLSGMHTQFLPEFLKLCTAGGFIAPPYQIPKLLGLGDSRSEIREEIIAISGNRGKWLAELTGHWEWMTGITQQVDWETDPFPQRLQLLKSTRKNDPQAAIRLLKTTWSSDSPEHKRKFLAELKVNLSPQDEPFLKHAAGDGRKEVREAAFELWGTLPNSQLAQNAASYFQQQVMFKKGLLKKTFEVKLPGKFTDELKALGVRQKLKPISGGQKANWLAQALAWVPPQVWKTHLLSNPVKLITLIHESEFALPLRYALGQSAFRWHDAPLIRAFIRGEINQEAPLPFHDFFSFLDETTFNAVLPELLKDGASQLENSGPLIRLLAKNTLPIHPDNARWIMGLFRTLTKGGKAHYYYYESRALLPKLSATLPPEMVAEFEQGWPTQNNTWSYWNDSVANLLSALRFRFEMKTAILNNR